MSGHCGICAGLVVQLLERWTCDHEVMGSTPRRVAIMLLTYYLDGWFVCGQVNRLGV